LGNDFVLVHASDAFDSMFQTEVDRAALAQRICDRRYGVGADGLLLITSTSTGIWQMTVYNSDGSRPEMCGNGLRCVAQYLVDTRRVGAHGFDIATDAGMKRVQVSDGMVEVDMGAIETIGLMEVEVDDRGFNGYFLDAGNPHFVVFEAWNEQEPEKFGDRLATHPLFPEGANISFASVKRSNVIELRVWERGCGLTMACGTGACATAVASWLTGACAPGPVTVELPGGALSIEGSQERVLMKGPAKLTFEGTWR